MVMEFADQRGVRRHRVGTVAVGDAEPAYSPAPAGPHVYVGVQVRRGRRPRQHRDCRARRPPGSARRRSRRSRAGCPERSRPRRTARRGERDTGRSRRSRPRGGAATSPAALRAGRVVRRQDQVDRLGPDRDPAQVTAAGDRGGVVPEDQGEVGVAALEEAIASGGSISVRVTSISGCGGGARRARRAPRSRRPSGRRPAGPGHAAGRRSRTAPRSAMCRWLATASARANSTRPGSVSSTPVGPRSRSGLPASRSSARRCWLTAGWVQPSSRAAALIEPARATARKISSRRGSMPGTVPHWQP